MSLVWPGMGWASTPTPVIEVGLNLVQNSITAAQTVIHTAKWVLELTALPEFVLAQGEFAEDLATLSRLVSDGQAIGMDVRSLEQQLQFFALDTAPRTSMEYAMRMGEIRQQVFLSYSYAMRTQTLIDTTLRTVRHVMVLMRDAASALGGLQSSQAIAQHEEQLVQIASELKVQTAAFDHATSVEQLSGPLTEQSMININETIWSDWADGDVGL
jgi:hypothetical protein